jgi:hypothetical protein
MEHLFRVVANSETNVTRSTNGLRGPWGPVIFHETHFPQADFWLTSVLEAYLPGSPNLGVVEGMSYL